MEAKGIRLQGEHGISRQTIAQGMPECSGCTCMLVCASHSIIAHETAGAASTRHSLLPLFRGKGIRASLGRVMRRENANAHSAVIIRLVRNCALGRVTQYSGGSSDRTDKPRRTGYPACAGYDDLVRRGYPPVMVSQRVARTRNCIGRHCERSEAIHLSASRDMDCFAALAMTRIGRGASDTPHVWDIARCSGRTKSSSGGGFRKRRSRPCESQFRGSN
jgi:hypothetical protein